MPLRAHVSGASATTAAATADAAAAAAATALEAAAAAATAAAVAPPRRAVRMTSFELVAQPAEGRRMLQAVAALLGRAGASCRVDANSWTVHAALPLQAAAAASDSAEPAAKRAKAGGEGAGGGGADGGLGVRVLLSQQARGSFTVAASIPNDSGDLAARRFTDVMHELKEDMGMMWQLKGQ
jgi:hypothetical protein